MRDGPRAERKVFSLGFFFFYRSSLCFKRFRLFLCDMRERKRERGVLTTSCVTLQPWLLVIGCQCFVYSPPFSVGELICYSWFIFLKILFKCTVSYLPLRRRDCDPLTEESAAGNACQIYTFKKCHQHHSKGKAAVFRKAPSFFFFFPLSNRSGTDNVFSPPPPRAVFTSSVCVSWASLYLRFFQPHSTRIPAVLSHVIHFIFLISESLYECAAGCCQRKNLSAARCHRNHFSFPPQHDRVSFF